MHVLVIFIDNGSVVRPTVADIVIDTNLSKLKFKGNLGVTSLWPSKIVIVELG